MSSTLYSYVSANKLLNKTTFKFICRERIRRSIRNIKYRASRYFPLFSCNKLMCSCKGEARVPSYCNYKLSRDIEKNPGPPIYIEPIKTTEAPYSQGKRLVFGQNAGQQCVKMSLWSLIYNNIQGISSANDLLQIMNIGKFVTISQTGVFSAVRITIVRLSLLALISASTYFCS